MPVESTLKFSLYGKDSVGLSDINRLPVDLPTTAFGELSAAELTPVVQYDAIYGINTKTDVETFSATGGSVSASNSEFVCQSGTSVGGYGLVRSKRVVRYRPGQGSLFRFTARFTTGVANSRQAAGAITPDNELTFGYSGTSFGILYRRNGVLEIRRLTIGTPASGNETATITLNGTAFQVAVTSGTAAHNAFEIASGTFTGWSAYQNGSTVTFISTSTGARSSGGAYTAASTGALAGTFSQLIAGADPTDDFIAQSSWNVDKVDGSSGTSFTLDPTKGNVYQIQIQYLGYGSFSFYVTNPNTARMTLVHRTLYANLNTQPSVNNPNFKLGWFAASLGSTTNLTVAGASMLGANQGVIRYVRPPQSQINSKTAISTSFTNVLSIRVRPEYSGRVNLSESILKFISLAVQSSGSKPSEAIVVLNPTLGGEPNWTYHDQTYSNMAYDTSATTVTVTSGQSSVILAAALPASGARDFAFLDQEVTLSRTDILTIAVRAVSGTVDATCHMTWVED